MADLEQRPDDAVVDRVVAEHGVDGAAARARRRTPERSSRRTRRVLWIVGSLVALLGVRMWAVEPVRLSSDSMAPGLRDGDQLVIDKLSYRWRHPERGEIVTAFDPQHSGWIIKRIVAIGGDSIGIEDGVLIRNGEPVQEPYIDNTNMDGAYFGPVDVPVGHVFVLGDTRSGSIDSRTYGSLALDQVTGRLMFSF